VKGDVLDDTETFLVTDFVNLNIKSVQSFKYIHTDSVCAFIRESAHMSMFL
jgi:hypothetical protein